MRALLIVLILTMAGCAGGGSDAPDPHGDPEPTSTDGTGNDPASPGNGTEEEPSPGPAGNGTGNSTGNSTEPKPFEPKGTDKPCNSLEVVSPATAATSGLVDGWALQRIDVAMVADPYFVAAHPHDWQTLLRDLVADASLHYEAQLDLRLRAVVVDALPEGSLDKSADADLIWDTARGFMNANHPDSEHDYVAVVLGADYNGAAAGQVQCVHGAYDQETAYLWTEYNGNRSAPYTYLGAASVLYDLPLKVFMHETAHLLAAHHHYTNCGEALAGYGTGDALAVCGVMINDIGLASFQFSPTNRLVMRSFVEETGIGERI